MCVCLSVCLVTHTGWDSYSHLHRERCGLTFTWMARGETALALLCPIGAATSLTEPMLLCRARACDCGHLARRCWGVWGAGEVLMEHFHAGLSSEALTVVPTTDPRVNLEKKNRCKCAESRMRPLVTRGPAMRVRRTTSTLTCHLPDTRLVMEDVCG